MSNAGALLAASSSLGVWAVSPEAARKALCVVWLCAGAIEATLESVWFAAVEVGALGICAAIAPARPCGGRF